MRARPWRAGAAVALAVLCGGALAHVRLHNPSNGNPLFWLTPGAISIVVNSLGSDDVPDDSDEIALRNAIAAWNGIPGSSAALVEDQSPLQQARTDWGADDLHLIVFDENNSSGFFPPASGIVAITPVAFLSSGRIVDADVLFNGAGHAFTTEQAPARFDVQDVAVHELGHLLGLDHTGAAGGSMYPYVDTAVILHRSIGLDEAAGMRDAYPAGAAFGSIQGTVRRASDASAVAGAFVVARDSGGRQAASILCNASGVFLLEGLAPGSYEVYARPLDQPVSAANLTTGWTIQTNFEPALYGAPIAVAAGATTAAGVLQVGANVAINLGQNLDPFPLRATAGASDSYVLRGTGLALGSTLTASDAALGVSATGWGGTLVTFDVAVPALAQPGHVDLTVVGPGGETSILPAALEITPPDPTVSSVTPDTAAVAGGTPLVILGSGFRAGARVVLGDQIYAEGTLGGPTLVDPTRLELTTAPTVAGLHDVVVIDATGVEGRLDDALLVLDLPVLDSVFPAAGHELGGTDLVLRGHDFADGLEVRINGDPVASAVVDGPDRVLVVTAPQPPGAYVLELENPDGAIASAAFAFVAEPDPALDAVAPTVGFAGQAVTLVGSEFTPDLDVVFGADPDTGLGGTPADSVVFVSPTTLTAVAPSGFGTVSVLVSAADGQADVLPAAFGYVSDGGGGGGCHTAFADGAATRPRAVLENTWWLAALIAWTLARAAAGKPARARARA